MGNHLSCMSPASLPRLPQVVSSNPNASSNLIQILHYEKGFLPELQQPLTAAEVMMESPGLFLCCYCHSLSSASYRICAIPADEDLRPGELYILLPMYKLNTRFSSEEMAAFAELVSQKKTSSSIHGASPPRHSQSKVAPLPSLDASKGAESILQSQSVKLDAPINRILQSEGATLIISRTDARSGTIMCRSKSWIPKLETITETRAASGLL